MSDEKKPKGKPSKTSKPKLRAAPPDGVVDQSLTPAHAAELAQSGLSEEYAIRAGVHSEPDSKAIADHLRWRWQNGGGMVFPFFDYDSGRAILSRVKPDKPRTRTTGTGKLRVVKYEQAPGTGAVPYFGPGTREESRLEDKSLPIVWAEGEKKTLALDSLGFAVLGLTGCHNWNDAEANRNGDGITWAKELKKYADRFVAGRRHVICLDSDCVSNDNVLLALRRLAGLLLETKALDVRYVLIPEDPADPSRGVGIDDFFHEHGEEKTRALVDAALKIAPGEPVDPIPPKDPLVRLSKLTWLRAAKLDKDLRLPPRFEVRRDRSIWIEPPVDKPEKPQTEIMRGALLPVRLLDSIDGEEQRVEIAFWSAGSWHRAIVNRHSLKSARRALDELPPTVAIDSNNAALVIGWCSEYFRHNEHRMKRSRFLGECGWQEVDGGACFLLDEPISKVASGIVADTSGDRVDALDALRPSGKLEEHRAALRAFFDAAPVAAMGFLAALSAPLLKPLKAPNFSVHFRGESTTGKTTILKCALGVYGDPGNGTWVGSWNTTPAAMEARAAMFCDLPLGFDEVGAGDLRSVEKSIYMLVNGEGRARSNRGLSSARTLSWRTVVMSSGEHEVTTSRANTGVQIRVLQLRTVGFAGMTRAQVDAMRDACDSHHGQVGREWIRALVDIDDWTPYRELFREAKQLFDTQAASALKQRQSVYWATMAVAEHLAHSLLGIGLEGGATVRKFVSSDSNRTEIETASERALESLSAWVYSDPLSFPRLKIDSNGAKWRRLSKGVKRVNGARDAQAILFVPTELQTRFDNDGISVGEVMSAWRENGITECDNGRTTKKLRIDGARTRFYVVKRDALGIDDAELHDDGADFRD